MRRLVKVLIASLIFFTNNVFAVLELELTQGVSNAMPVAVLPFIGQEIIQGSDNDMLAVVRNDLKNCGRFRLVTTQMTSAEAPNFEAWRSQKIEGVLTGQVTSTFGGGVKIKIAIYDVYKQKKLVEREYDIKKTQLRRLAHHVSDIFYQEFTGDRGVFSTKIAYVLVKRSGRAAQHQLQVADSDGYNPRTLLTSRFPIMSPRWSPDGKQMAYVSFEGNRAAIYIQEMATGKRKVLTKFPGINGAPAWSPDGRKMAIVLTQTGYPKIYVLDLITNNLERITGDWYLDTEPCWDPDGHSLIFTSNRSNSPQIYRVYLDNKKVERLTYNGRYNARASFVPNGNAIVMLHQLEDMFTIAMQELQTKRVSVLTKSGLNESPSVAPNGKMVVYATNINGRGMLAEVSIDGRVKILLPAGEGQVQEPAWSPFFN